ncbi:polymer-forming cytoskeletal protein [Uliginosibacterium sp. H3]|uniref:Polymer-forming cytoskeletal protein n=1 Tax=Uliginosibacterium silvisoli TaxID=3114758 RepID=A0ABU6K4J8_9RHOO|nr:polymer-forming cytoskeletal protein [Uliginosibacterium sp. H3]
MFAKQSSVLGKNDSLADRRPVPLTSSGNPGTSSAAQSSGNGSTSSSALPLHPALQSSATPARAASTPQAEPTGAPEAALSPSRLIVGPDVKLKGAEILDCDTLVVEGRVEATMDSRVIRIAEHGAFSGKVGIDIAEVFGEFDGDLTAREQLIIHATGRVSGRIRYGKLLVEEGGTLSGDIQSLSATSTPLSTPLSESQFRHNPSSATSEKEANTQMKSHLSTVAG